jgi:ABC-type tungstate transport system substrate-binding protein
VSEKLKGVTISVEDVRLDWLGQEYSLDASLPARLVGLLLYILISVCL